VAGGAADVVARLPPATYAGWLRGDTTNLYLVAGDPEQSEPFQVLRLPVAGGSPTVLATDAVYESAIALDDESVFYVTESTDGTKEAFGLAQVAKSGGASVTLVMPTAVEPMAMAADDRAVFWTAANGVFMIAK
jgi:hypothetical protein